MPGELNIQYAAGSTLYVVLRNDATGSVFNTDSGGFETWDDANVADYAIALTDVGGGYYLGDLPDDIAAGVYDAAYHVQAGAAPAPDSDLALPGETIRWLLPATDTPPADTGSFLTTLAKVKALLGIEEDDTSRDDELTMLIDVASSMVRNWCDRDFTLQNYVELYDAAGFGRIALNQYPIVSVAGVTYHDETVDSDCITWTAGGERYGGILTLAANRYGWGNVQVSYSAGYASIPNDIQMAVAHIVAAMDRETQANANPDIDRSLKGERIGDYSYTNFDARDRLASTALESLAPRAAAILQKYRRIPSL